MTLVTLGIKNGDTWYLYRSCSDCVNIDGPCFAVVNEEHVKTNYRWVGSYHGLTMLIKK